MNPSCRSLLIGLQRCTSGNRKFSKSYVHRRSYFFNLQNISSRSSAGPLRNRILGANFDTGRSYCCQAEFVVKSPHGDTVIPDLRLHEYIWEQSSPWGHKIALQCGITGRQYTFSEARDLARYTAASLQNKFGLKKGDCFAVVLPNLPEFPIIFLAGSEAGLIMTPVNPVYTPGEISKQFINAEVKLVFTVTDKVPAVEEAIKLYKQKIPIVVVQDRPDVTIPEGTIPYSELIDKSTCGSFKSVVISKNDTLVLPYSSGTTGLPKGVELTHHNVVANVHQLGCPGVRVLRQTTEEFQDVVLGILPMYHIYGLVVVLYTAMAAGSKLVTLPKFEPTVFIESLVKYKASLLYLVPPLILFLGSHPAVKPEHLRHVRSIISGAAPCGKSDVERFLQKREALYIQGYGLTEAAPCILNTHQGRTHKYASSGVPVPSTLVKIVDVETGKPQPAGKIGELVATGPQVMKGYYKNPEATKETFDHHGWLRTGDLAYYDEEGDFYVVDRLKELIKVKGFQVAPAELEEILRSHPKVIDAAVIGLKDQGRGEQPKAFIVLKPGITSSEDEIKEFVARQVAEYKRLEGGVMFLDSIPKSAAGKILRKELKAKYGN